MRFIPENASPFYETPHGGVRHDDQDRLVLAADVYRQEQAALSARVQAILERDPEYPARVARFNEAMKEHREVLARGIDPFWATRLKYLLPPPPSPNVTD